MPCGDPVCPRCRCYVYVGDDGRAHCGCPMPWAGWSPLGEPTDAERIAALERRVEALEAARCPECHADLINYDHKMSCGRGDGKGLRLSGKGLL